MKIAFYSPYLPKHTGGGEKYLFDCALLSAEAGHQVFMAISSDHKLSETEIAGIRSKYEQFLDCPLTSLKFISSPLFTEANFWQKLLWTKQFDCLYYQTDGSLFFSLTKKNILHIQVPLPLDKTSLFERLKLANWPIKNSNSFFTKKYIEKYWQTKVDFVHQPFVELPPMESPPEKEKIILSVGRFFCQLHSKRQDILVNMFKKLVKENPKILRGWRLVLIGKKEDDNFAKKVAEDARSHDIEIIHDVDRSKLLDYYQRASLFWHATGYGINEEIEPEKAEHFGISTLEAMAASVVPLVINKGGQKEILGEELKKCLWQDEAECLAKTLDLIKNIDKRASLAKLARDRSQIFSREKFKKILLAMLEK